MGTRHDRHNNKAVLPRLQLPFIASVSISCRTDFYSCYLRNMDAGQVLIPLADKNDCRGPST